MRRLARVGGLARVRGGGVRGVGPAEAAWPAQGGAGVESDQQQPSGDDQQRRFRPVLAVTANTTALTSHNRQSRRSVRRSNLTAAMVMMAITAGAIA